MTIPSASEAAAKVAKVAGATHSSAKDVKKESTVARVLGAGTYIWSAHQSFHCINTNRYRWYRRVDDFPPRRHDRKAFDEQPGQGTAVHALLDGPQLIDAHHRLHPHRN